MNCRKCSSTRIAIDEVTFSNGTKHLRRTCSDCATPNGYEAREVSHVDIENFIMPFGKFKGSTLDAIRMNDPTYLEWASLNLTGNVARKIQKFMETKWD